LMTFSIGAGMGLFNGVRRMSRTIVSGGLDPWLAQPAPVLLRVLFARVEPALMGDLVFGPVLFALTGHRDVGEWLRFLLAATLAAVMVTSFIVATESLAFWMRSGEEVANVALGALMVSGTYPADIYGGVGKILVYSLVPSALVTTTPARFVLRFDAT